MALFGKKWILWFNELNKSHNDLVGKKCANLGEISRLGLRVPPGFAISLDGYQLFLKKTGIGDKIQLTINTYGDQLEQNIKEASDVLKDLFRSTPMPLEMEKEIKKHLYYSMFSERIKALCSEKRFNFYLFCLGDTTNLRAKEFIIQKYHDLSERIGSVRENSFTFVEYTVRDDEVLFGEI